MGDDENPVLSAEGYRDVPKQLVLYAERYEDRIATARLIVQDRSNHPGAQADASGTLDHFENMYDLAFKEGDLDALAKAAEGIEFVISLLAPGRQINLCPLPKTLNSEPGSSSEEK